MKTFYEQRDVEMSEAKSLTTKEVARLCRVSDATVKRWEEAGEIKSERTSGGHRRFRAEEVARFQCKLGIRTKTARSGKSIFSLNSRRRSTKTPSGSPLFHSLVEGREEDAAEILIKAYLNREPLSNIFDSVICPELRRIGDLWVCGDLNVAQEHLATRTVLSAIQKLRGVLPVADITGEIAMCCAPEGDLHDIPTQLVQLCLENEGFEVVNFGANTPLYSFTEEVGCYAPNVICISATMITDIERISRDYNEFRQRISKLKIPIVLGGRAFEDKRLRDRFPAELYAENFKQLADLAREIANETRI